jgi:hypothetical protein
MRCLRRCQRLGLSRSFCETLALGRADAAEMELMEMSCRRPREAWSLPAVAAPALALWARWRGVDNAAVGKEFFKSGHRFRQQGVGFSVGSMRLFAQPLIGSPVHAARLLRKRVQRVVAPAEPHLDHLRSAHCATYGNLPLARVDQPQASPTGEARPVKLCNAPATNLTVGSGQAFEPRPAAAEVAFCPYDRDSLLDNPRFCGAGRANAVDQHDGVRLGHDEDLARRCTIPEPLVSETQSRSQQVLPLQLSNINSIEVLASVVSGYRPLKDTAAGPGLCGARRIHPWIVGTAHALVHYWAEVGAGCELRYLQGGAALTALRPRRSNTECEGDLVRIASLVAAAWRSSHQPLDVGDWTSKMCVSTQHHRKVPRLAAEKQSAV